MAQPSRTLTRQRRKRTGVDLSWETVKFKQCGSPRLASPLKSELRGYSANVVGTRVYLFGGFQNGRRSNSLFVFDYSTRSWLQLPTSGLNPSVRAGHTSTLYEDCLLIYGGSSVSGRTLGDVWKLDLVLGAFSQCSRLNIRRTGHSADLIAGRHEVLCFGGRALQDVTAVTNTLLRLHLGSFTLSEVEAKGQAPSRRTLHSSCVCHDTLFIFGGFTNGSSSHLNDLHFLAPVVSQRGWSYTWHTPIVHGWIPRARLASSWTYAWGYMFLIGGLDLRGKAQTLSDVDVFDPGNRTWTKCSSTSSAVLLDRIRLNSRLLDQRESHVTVFTGASLISLRGSASDFDRFDVLRPASG